MKVTEKFLTIYEDVIKGRVPLDVAQKIFCEGEDKNRWYNLKSRLKNEVKAIESANGTTEREQKRVDYKFTESMKFLYCYEKMLKDELTVEEAEAAVCGDNKAKWYNLKAREKEAVQKLEKKYHKVLTRGNLVDMPNKQITKKSVSDTKLKAAAKVKQEKTKGMMKPKRSKAMKATVTERKEVTGKPDNKQGEKGVFGKKKEVAGFSSIKECFLHYYEKVLKGEMTEADARVTFEGIEDIRTSWGSYKQQYKDIIIKMAKDMPKKHKGVKKAELNHESEIAPDVTDIPSDSIENTSKTHENISKGNSRVNGKSTSKKAKTGVKRGKKSGKVSNAQEIGIAKPKKEEKKGNKRVIVEGVTSVPETNGTEHPVGATYSDEDKKKAIFYKAIKGFKTLTNRKLIFLKEYLKVKEGYITCAEARKNIVERGSYANCWYAMTTNFKVAINDLDSVYEEGKLNFSIEDIEGITTILEEYGKIAEEIEKEDLRSIGEIEDIANEVKVSKEPIFESEDEEELPAIAEGTDSTGILSDTAIELDNDTNLLNIGLILPKTRVMGNIKEIRQELYEKYKEGSLTKEDLVKQGEFDDIADVTRWLKHKENKSKTKTDNIEIEEEIEESEVIHKEKAIINPNEDKTMFDNESFEQVVDDSILFDKEEDIDEIADYEEDVAKEAEDVNVEKLKQFNEVLNKTKLAQAEGQGDDEECPYHCVNGRIFLESRGLVPCPHCSGIDRKQQLLDDSKEVSLYSLLKIPPQFRDITSVSDEVLQGLREDSYINTSIIEVKDFLNTVVEAVRESSVASISAYVHISNNLDIRPYVYGLQREAIEHGIGTVPYISLNTLAALLYASNAAIEEDIDEGMKKERLALGNIAYTTNAFRRLATDFPCDYYDYCKAPLVILEATAETLKRGWSTLADLLAERAREGLPTYVFGYHSSTSGMIQKELHFLTTDNFKRLDRLNIIELKTKGKGNRMIGIRSFKNVSETVGEVEAGVKLRSFVNVAEEEEQEVRRASEVFRGY